ncbi:hypothetical protein BCR42DRAFT_426258 [Absidia repens]|uniref:Uncharacterized protein n=1 Tax=Absidia repens TaxID=90262 RepID=A0A1X2I1S3_9FUNG|nr:hypothetical protein BCR42DRAFT_426258 [Absidia repens]
MKKLVEESSDEYPAHSLIMDPNGSEMGKFIFTAAEILELTSYERKRLADLPPELDQYMSLYDKSWTNAVELYQFADAQKHHPIDELDKKWMKESLMKNCRTFPT